MPFVVLLFWQTCLQMISWSGTRLYWILLLILLNILLKPSYIIVYVISLPVTAFIQNRYFLKSIFVSMFASSLLFLQYYHQYLMSEKHDDSNTVIISPFSFYMHWNGVSDSMILTILLFAISLLLSFALPIYVLIKKNIMEFGLLFSTITMVAALLIGILLEESGSRATHGNFFWQIYASAFVFFLSTITEVLPELSKKPIYERRCGIRLYKLNAYQVLLLLHLTFGCLYILRLLISQEYF